MEKHCCAFALVGADFKAADADMADATAGSFHPPPPSSPLCCSSTQPPSEADTERKIKYLRLIMTLFINM